VVLSFFFVHFRGYHVSSLPILQVTSGYPYGEHSLPGVVVGFLAASILVAVKAEIGALGAALLGAARAALAIANIAALSDRGRGIAARYAAVLAADVVPDGVAHFRGVVGVESCEGEYEYE
jgi:stage V sporulation protein SpoVS